MISGTNGLLGAADGAFIMQKKKRTDNTAVMAITGRDQQDQELTIEFDHTRCVWNFKKAETELWKQPPDPLLDAVVNIIPDDTGEWTGSASELLALLSGHGTPAEYDYAEAEREHGPVIHRIQRDLYQLAYAGRQSVTAEKDQGGVTVCDDSDGVLHSGGGNKNTVTTVTIVTENQKRKDAMRCDMENRFKYQRSFSQC